MLIGLGTTVVTKYELGSERCDIIVEGKLVTLISGLIFLEDQYDERPPASTGREWITNLLGPCMRAKKHESTRQLLWHEGQREMETDRHRHQYRSERI